ncbi:MAG: hypothetical protein ACI9KE_004789 [Polyangiales bacterium]|jgi:hypothetical protein
MLCVGGGGGCLIYAGIGFAGVMQAGVVGPLTYVLPGIGVLMLPTAFILARLVPVPDIASPTEEVDGAFGKEMVLADPTNARDQYVTSVFNRFAVRCLVIHSAAIFGLMGYLGAGTPIAICVGLCGVAGLATLSVFPRTSDWKMRAETKIGARFPNE